MKTKLSIAVVVGVLLSLLVLPVLADTDDVSMWVSHIRLTYVGRSPKGTDAVVGYIHVRDANRRNVAGATVTVQWTLDGEFLASDVVETSRRGLAKSYVWAGPGVYRVYIIDVVKTGWVYDPTVVASPDYTVD